MIRAQRGRARAAKQENQTALNLLCLTATFPSLCFFSLFLYLQHYIMAKLAENLQISALPKDLIYAIFQS